MYSEPLPQEVCTWYQGLQSLAFKMRQKLFWNFQTTSESLCSDLVLEGGGTVRRVKYYFRLTNTIIWVFEQILFYEILTKAFLFTHQKLFSQNHQIIMEKETSVWRVRCSSSHDKKLFWVFFQDPGLGAPWYTKEWKNILLKMLNTYEDDNQITGIHYAIVWGSGNGEREVKDFQWNEEEFPFSEDFLKFRYHPKGFLICPTPKHSLPF